MTLTVNLLTSIPGWSAHRRRSHDSRDRNIEVETPKPPQSVAMYVLDDLVAFASGLYDPACGRFDVLWPDPLSDNLEDGGIDERVGESAPLSTFQITLCKSNLIESGRVPRLAMSHAGYFVQSERR